MPAQRSAIVTRLASYFSARRAGRALASSHKDVYRPRESLIGVSLFLLSLALAVIHMGLSKKLTADLPVPLIVWARYVVFLALTLPLAARSHGLESLRHPAIGLMVARGCLITTANLLFIAALAYATLASMTAILFIYPFLLALMTPIILGEPISSRSWIAVSAGFAGVLIVIRPSASAINWPGLCALVAGASFGLQLLLTRRASRTAAPLLVATFTALVGVIIMTAALPLYWQTPTLYQIIVLLAIGTLVTLSQAAMIVACRKTEMGILAPFAFCEIVFAVAVGYVFFGDVPGERELIGITVIGVSGLFVVTSAGRDRSQPPLPRP